MLFFICACSLSFFPVFTDASRKRSPSANRITEGGLDAGGALSTRGNAFWFSFG